MKTPPGYCAPQHVRPYRSVRQYHRSKRNEAVISIATIVPALARHRQRWKALVAAWRPIRLPGPGFGLAFNHLTEVYEFGSNPGALRMFTYVPARPQSALVVVLHGSAQTAASYDLGAGWSTLADRYGFALLLPQQQVSNNPNNGFNWFLPSDIERGKGEALSICQMIETMFIEHGIDRTRVFVTGLSAGGAMTCVMLAIYPELFAAGAVIAGLPFGTATNVNEAFESMFHVRARSAREWGNLVRAASPHRGPWPRVSVWHGSADTVVMPQNADQIVKQWIDVHGLDHAPARIEMVDGNPRRVWRNHAGSEVIESYTIFDMAHGTPLASGTSEKHCGVPGAFLLDVGISSSYHIAKFWGLTEPPHKLTGVFARWRRNRRPGSTAASAGTDKSAAEADLARRSGANRSFPGRAFVGAALIRFVKRLRRRLSL
jgi:poly(hydroxyalkanoate) depolymerase family esterase